MCVFVCVCVCVCVYYINIYINVVTPVYRLSERLYCSVTNGHFPGLSLDHTARIARIKTHLQKPDNTVRKPGDTASYNPGDTARKRSSTDLAGWQHTMGWRPPSPGIDDRWRPSTNWLPSAPDLASPPPNKSK